MNKLPKVLAVTFGLLLLVSLYQNYNQYTYIENKLKPHIKQQDVAILQQIEALEKANEKLLKVNLFVLESIKTATGNDVTKREQALWELFNFKPETAVMPPKVPEKLDI